MAKLTQPNTSTQREPTTAAHDKSAGTVKQESLELTDEELNKVSGGAVDSFIWFEPAPPPPPPPSKAK